MKQANQMCFWLIQRMMIRDAVKETAVGIDRIMSMDYMGAAEFEFDTLPTALREICRRLDKLDTVKMPTISRTILEDGHQHEQGMYLICEPDKRDQIAKFLEGQATDPYKTRLKEPTRLQDAIEKPNGILVPCAWWDVENHWMAIFGKKNANNLVAALRRNKSHKGW